MWNRSASTVHTNVTCPFCGLGCDDLSIDTSNRAEPRIEQACALGRAGFAAALTRDVAEPMIEGRKVSLDQALARAVELLDASHSPLLAGLATDVNGMRGVLELADRIGAGLDQVNGDALFRNLLVMQDGGWFTTTLTEVRNRADLVVLAGGGLTARFPRLVERVLGPPHSLYVEAGQRRVVLLGDWDGAALPTDLAALSPELIELPAQQIGEYAGLLRGLLAGHPVRTEPWGAAGAAAVRLVERLADARYSVIAWSAAGLDFAHAELGVQNLVELARELNRQTRSAALPLAGSLGDLTAHQVCTWQTGLPLRQSLHAGHPEYDPVLLRDRDRIERNETDLLMWISGFAEASDPPAGAAPGILLAPPGAAGASQAAVYLPVGTPGIDHPGHWFRSDSVCPLPLSRLRDSGLPSVGQLCVDLASRVVVRGTEARPC